MARCRSASEIVTLWISAACLGVWLTVAAPSSAAEPAQPAADPAAKVDFFKRPLPAPKPEPAVPESEKTDAKADAKSDAKSDAKPDAKSEAAKSLRTARASIVQQFRDKNPEARAAAIKKLAAYPGVDGAKILLLQALVSTYEDVRHGAVVTLLAFASAPEVTEYLRGEVAKDVRRPPAHFATAAGIAVLLAAEDEKARDDAETSLDKLAELPDGPLLMVTLVDELSLHPSEATVKLLQGLSRTQFFRKKYGPRRALAQALIKMQQKPAIDTLLQILRGVQGETRADIERYLTELNGQKLKTDEAWAEWWKMAGPTFEFPTTPQKLVPVSVVSGPSYYGIPLYGAKIVFVIDASGSMRGPRIEAAKRELSKAIYDLPDGTEFNVLAFSDGVLPWQRQLTVASKDTKPSATQFVQKLGLSSQTHSYDALEAALGYDVEAIYFLTDGQPNGGKITQPAKIVSVISRMNRVRRVTIHAIGVGVGPEGNGFDLFLKALAGENFGGFRRVDE